MNAQDLKNSILQLAIQGKLVEQKEEEEGTAEELYAQIQEERKRLIEEGHIRKKKAMEIADEETPFEIPPNWKWLRVSELGEVIGGGTPKTSVSEYWKDGDISWLTPADMKNVKGKYVSSGSRSITKEGLQSSSARLMPKGAIVYSSRAPIGYIAIAKNELSTNQGFKSLVPLIEGINEYMYFCLISRTSEIQSRASGTTFKEISGTEFGKTLVPLPPIKEQKRIVAKVEELMPLVEKYGDAHTAVTDLNEQFPVEMEKSILQYAIQGKLVEQRPEEGIAEELYAQIQEQKQELIENGKIKKPKKLTEITEEEIPFGIPDSWMWSRLGDIVSFDIGKTPPRSEGKFWGNDFWWVSIADMVDRGYIKETKEKVSALTLDEKFKNYLVPKGTLLMSFKLTIGKISILEVDAVHNEAIISIYPFVNEDYITRDYLFRVLPFMSIYGDAKSAIKGNTLNKTSLNNLLIPLPPIEEQKRIVERIEELLPYTKQLIK